MWLRKSMAYIKFVATRCWKTSNNVQRPYVSKLDFRRFNIFLINFIWRCDHPTPMVGKELVELLNAGSKLRCSDKYNHVPEGDGTILVGILIGKANCNWCRYLIFNLNNMWTNLNTFSGVLIGIPLALAIVFVYKRGCFGLSRNRGAAAYSRAFYKRAEMGDDFHI